MPDGVTLGSTGIFNGTPTTAGTFGPYVFEATDSKGLTAKSQSMSILIHPAALRVTTGGLPNGIVGSAYSATLVASGGTPPYTWGETSGGALPPGLANVTSAGLILGTPTTTGTYGPYVFTVTDSTGATAASVGMVITINGVVSTSCTPQGNEQALPAGTPYAFLLRGTDGSGNPIDIAGSFTPNGSGGITNATVDYNGFTSGPEQMQVDLASSLYSFGANTFGCLHLVFSGPVTGAASTRGSQAALQVRKASALKAGKDGLSTEAASTVTSASFLFTLGQQDSTGIYHAGRIMESDAATLAGTIAAGSIHLQLPSSFAVSALQPNFVIGMDGWSASASSALPNRTSFAGSIANSNGVLSAGYADLNVGGTASGELTGGTGQLGGSVDPNTGRGTGTYTIPTSTGTLAFDFVYYVLNGSALYVITADAPSGPGSQPLLAGGALVSSPSYAAGALSGFYLLASDGFDPTANSGKGGNFVQIGTANATSAGTIGTSLYTNDAGTYGTEQYTTGSYTVEAASGRVSSTGLGTTPPVFYLTANSPDDEEFMGFLVGTSPMAESGVLVNQSTGTANFVPSSISGNYVAGTGEDVDGAGGTYLGAYTFTGTGGYVAISQIIGSVPQFPHLGSYTVNTDGSGGFDAGALSLVTNGTEIFAIPTSGDPLLFFYLSDTLPLTN